MARSVKDELGSALRRAADLEPDELQFLEAEARRWKARAPSWPGGRVGPGAPDDERARWLLDFAVMDLNGLSEADWQNLYKAINAFLMAPTMVGEIDRKLRPRDVRALQRWLLAGLLLLCDGPRAWQIARYEVLLFQWTRRRGLTQVSLRQDRLPVGATAEIFMAMTATLLVAVATRFRFCNECGRAFISRKSQGYCNRRCSQATRTRRFRTKQAGRR